MANLGNITVNVSLNGPLDVEKLAEEFKASIRKEIERVGVKVEVAKPEYRKLTGRVPKSGDFLKFTDTTDGDITIGKYYEIIRFDNDGDPEFYDDIEDINVAISEHGEVYNIYEKVIEANEKLDVEAKRAKIGRRHNEFKKGDIVRGVRYDDSSIRFIGEAEDVSDKWDTIGVRSADGIYHAVYRTEAVLIAPVEIRVDC
jgi:hypothetical protein